MVRDTKVFATVVTIKEPLYRLAMKAIPVYCPVELPIFRGH